MKKIVMIAFCLPLLAAMSAYSQAAPGVDFRQQHQRTRIQQGIVKGGLTHGETAQLRLEQRHIRRYEHCSKTDGLVTRWEQRRLNRMQNKASRDIYLQKHNAFRKLKVI